MHIERLWRDIGEGVISVFSSLFHHLEVQGIHDPCSDLDIFTLHYVFMPRIQRSLDRLAERFSYHLLSTEGNRTPRQLWASRCLHNFASPNSGVRDVLTNKFQRTSTSMVMILKHSCLILTMKFRMVLKLRHGFETTVISKWFRNFKMMLRFFQNFFTFGGPYYWLNTVQSILRGKQQNAGITSDFKIDIILYKMVVVSKRYASSDIK